jgi:CBS domain-containing protein
MSRDTPVRDVMSTEVLTFAPDDNVRDAMAALVDRSIDAAPVVDGSGAVVGMLSTGDLIVQETQLHFPTVISLLGATLELPSSQKHFEDDLRKALGGTVEDVMSGDPVVCGEDDSIERAATLMHENDVSRLPVVRDGRLVGIVSRTDVLRVVLREQSG